MIQTKNTFEPKLQQLESQLAGASNPQEAINKLISIKDVLKTINVEEVYSIKDLMVKHLKPISKDVTNLSPKHALPKQQQLEQLLIIIVNLYSRAARYRFEVMSIEFLTQLLERSSRMIKVQSSWDDDIPQESKNDQKSGAELKWIARKKSTVQDHTQLYYKCLNLTLQNLEGVEAQFIKSGLNFVKEFMNFLFKFSNSINLQKLSNLVSQIVLSLENVLVESTISKQLPKQFSTDSIKSVSQAGAKLSNSCNKSQIKSRFEMLGSMYGLALLGSPSIEKKLNGLKIINKQSEQFYRSGISFIKEQQYVAWLFDNKVVDLILEESSQSPILKNCNYIFRIIFKRRCLNEKNMQKIYDYIENSSIQNRQLILRYFQQESIRLGYSDYEQLIRRLKNQHKPEFYEEDFFIICSQCIRYSTQTTLKQFVQVLGKILKQNYRKFRNQKIQQKCIKSYVKAIVRLLEKDSDMQMKKSIIEEIYNEYFKKQITQLGLLVFKTIFEQLPQISEISKSKAASFLIVQKNIIQVGLQTLKRKTQDVALRKDMQEFLCFILKLANDSFGGQKIQFTVQTIINSIYSPKMFESIVSLIQYNNNSLETTFQQLLNRFQVENIPFQCLKSLFFRINYIYMRQVKQYNQESYFQVLCSVAALKGYESLKYLLLNTSTSQNRNSIAEFIADLYTSFPQSRTAQAELQLQKFLKQTLMMTLEEKQKKEDQTRLLGYLALVQYLMMNTEYLGAGKYKPHNSLVPISTVQIRIMNDFTYGSDVSQSFWKKVSSNITLFDLLSLLSEKFRCSVCQISLQQGDKYWPEKWNGLILQQLDINEKLLKAVKSPKQKIRKQKLIQMGQITQKARKAFEEIYKTFAVDGKMGKKQCANFVSGVTKTSSSVHDSRVIQFFREFDLDQDDNITFDDFLRFYKQHCTPDRDQIVWKNLHSMRFRKDLRKYDDPIEVTNQNLLFRALLYKSQEFYDLLFQNSESQNKQLEQRCKKLLLRLPTYPKTLESAKSDLNLIQKNCFQTQYMLIAIQSKLNSPDQDFKQRIQNKHQFIECGNFMRIYQMMLRIDKMSNSTQDEKKCLFVSLQILRSLLTVPDLRENIEATTFLHLNLQIEDTYLFLKLAQEALKSVDIDIFQSALALQLTQTNKSLDFALRGIFHDEVILRRICCNYVFVLCLQDKINIDLFAIEQKQNCQIWFETLNRICRLDNKVNSSAVIRRSLQKAKLRRQNIENNQDDSIIFGNLSIISSLIQKYGSEEDITQDIIQIAGNILSVRSRKLIYSILGQIDAYYAIQYASHLIDSVDHMREVQPKKYYVGLKNLGSTCYMNSILQVLFCVQEFKSLILSLSRQNIQKTEVKGVSIYDDTIYQLQKMYTYLLQSQKKYFNPQQFCFTIKIGNTNDPIDPKVQEDAHQFISKFLDKLQKQIQKTGKIEIFRELLQGSTVTQVTCKKCSNKINREQKFSQISLAVQNIKSLEQSFEKYILPQEIEDYFCSSCNCKVQKIEKSTFLNKLPKLLTINLQRIVYDLEDFIFKKIDSSFTFPQSLNVSNYVLKQSNLTNEDYEFRLKAILVHSGNSEAGHYYSIIKIENDWFKFNDQTVTKIEFNSIQHECFGGAESKQEWTNDLKYSTNAYMLFYEKSNSKQVQIQYKFEQELKMSIQKQNEKFYRQLQVHQQSIFLFAFEIFQKFQQSNLDQKIKLYNHEEDWMNNPNLIYYEAMYDFMIRLLKFSTVFYDVKSEYIFYVGQILFKLFYLLPQKAEKFLTQITPDQCIQYLCLHNDQTIRNIYKHLLNKSMHVFFNYNKVNFSSQTQAVTKVLTIIDTLFAYLEDQRLLKNINKSVNYFDFWKTCCEFIPEFIQYLIQHEALTILANLILRNDSGDSKKKQIQIPSYCIPSIVQIIGHLMGRKKNLKDYIHPLRIFPTLKYYELSDKEKLIYGNVKFYQKMMNSKCDSSHLGLIASRLCEKDLQFSKALAPVFLKGLNNISNPQSAIGILNYLNQYLSINDQFTEFRLKWILGIPQLRAGDELVYGLTYEDQSLAFEYISPLFFMKSEKEDCKTALAIMYQNHSTYNSFSVEGVSLLLNLMCVSEKMFHYVLKLPAPIYLHKSYLGWVQKYINNFRQSYFMQDRLDEKINTLQKMTEMHNFLTNKIKSEQIDLPVNKKIIGRNKDLYAVESIYNEDCKMTLWAHLTYVLPNQPQITHNKSLPKQLFKFASPSGFAKFFVSIGKTDIMQQSEELQTELTTYTLQVDTKQILKLKFKLTNFKQQLQVKGKVFINFPYEEFAGGLESIVEVHVKKIEQKPIQKDDEKLKQEVQALSKNQQILDECIIQSVLMENQCKICTYINNPGAKSCEMCDTDL